MLEPQYQICGKKTMFNNMDSTHLTRRVTLFDDYN